jgi:hypothetical protein
MPLDPDQSHRTRQAGLNCLGATSANALAPGSRSLRPPTIDPERLPPSPACSAARGLPAVDLKNGLARAGQRVQTQVAREAGVLQGGTVMLRQRLEQVFENQTAFRIGVFGLGLAPVLMVLAVLFVD